ncbi:MAG: hypothetical protein HYY40_12755 [Bacteroidetes bacterium]|nr:hypothetical protein [Bacteroidota bacterium]
MTKFKNPLSLFLIPAVCFSMLWAQKDHLNEVLQYREKPLALAWDVYGYYLFLPSVFIYNDIGLTGKWLDETYHKYCKNYPFYQVAPGTNGRRINIFVLGMAFIYSPAFFSAHAYAKIFGYPPDGFSAPYNWSMIILAMLYAFAGVFLLRKILLRYFNDLITFLTMICLFWGTNYFFQCGIDGTLPHNYLFTLNCFFLLLVMKWHETGKLFFAAATGFMLGFLTLCRPTEIILIFIPLLFNIYDRHSWNQKIQFFKTHYPQYLAFAVSVFIAVLPQLLYWKYSSGNWISIIREETLSLSEPYIVQTLFSYKKGWFVYTPMMLVAVIGFYHLFVYNKNIFFAIFSFFILNLYVQASWDNWWHGPSFSQRSLVESYAVTALPLGYFIYRTFSARRILKFIFLSVLLLLVIYNLFKIWQFRVYIIDGERMTREYFWRTFLTIGGITEEDKSFLEIDRNTDTGIVATFDINKYNLIATWIDNFEEGQARWDTVHTIDTFSFDGSHCFTLTSDNPFSRPIAEKYHNITDKDHIFIKASVKVYLLTEPSNSNSALCICVQCRGNIYKWRSWGAAEFNLVPGKWNTISTVYLTPILRHRHDEVRVFYWNTGTSPVFIDNLVVEAYEQNDR